MLVIRADFIIYGDSIIGSFQGFERPLPIRNRSQIQTPANWKARTLPTYKS